MGCRRWGRAAPGSVAGRSALARHPNPVSGVLHEKQTDAELGELLRRLQAANLEAAELGPYERVGATAGMHAC